MTADPTKKLASLIRKLKGQYSELSLPSVAPEAPDEFDAIVHELVFSMLLWEANTNQAKNALKKIRESVVDYNELRVCVADEVSQVIGEKYPLSIERAMRLRTVLNDIYQHQHAISLKHLAELGKRETRQYLEHLSGCPPFVAARVCLAQGLGHAIPVDERLCDLLVGEQVIEKDATVEQATSWLEHHIKSEEGREVCLLLQAWSDEHGHAPKRDKRPITIQVQPTTAEKHEAKAEAKHEKHDGKAAKTSAKGRTKPEAATKKTKSKPRSGS